MDSFPIQDESLQAILKAAREELAAIDRTVLLIADIANVDASALPWLGDEYNVMGYKGWLLAESDAERRALIESSYEAHSRMGTLDGIKRAIALVGYIADVKPWYEYGGDPYHIRVDLVDAIDKGITEETYGMIRRMVEEWKAARTLLDSIELNVTTSGKVYAGAVAMSGVTAWAMPGEQPVPIACVYPLDVKPQLISQLGFEAFTLGDPCGHSLTASGTDSHAAISQAAAEALLSGGQIPEEHILPPSYLGEGVYAVEYLLDVTNIEDKDGLFALAAGGYRPLTPEHGGGNYNVVLFSENSVVVMQVGAVTHDQRYVNRNFIGRTSVRLGIYYNTVNKQVGFNIGGEDVGYLGEYTHDEPFILMAAKQAWVVPEYSLSADVSIEVLTKGKELQLAYPEGTLGLDGEPALAPEPITSKAVFIPEQDSYVSYYTGYLGGEPVGVLINAEQWQIGTLQLIRDTQQLLAIHVNDAEDVMTPTHIEVYVNDELVSGDMAIERYDGGVLAFGIAYPQQQQLLEAGETYTLEVIFAY